MRHVVLLFIGLLTACTATSRTTTTTAVIHPRESTTTIDLSEAISSILSGDPHGALQLTNAESRESPWREYIRGVALADLKRPDDAAAAFDAAARLFASTFDGAHGRCQSRSTERRARTTTRTAATKRARRTATTRRSFARATLTTPRWRSTTRATACRADALAIGYSVGMAGRAKALKVPFDVRGVCPHIKSV